MPEQHITIELNPSERRLWDRLRSRVVAEPPPGGGSGVVDLLLLLPDLTVLLARLMRDARVPITSKAVALAGVGYVLSPLDVVPALFFGPVGLIDDLVIVSVALSRLLRRVHPDVVRSHWSGRGDALVAIYRVTSWVEARFSLGVGSVLGRLLRR